MPGQAPYPRADDARHVHTWGFPFVAEIDDNFDRSNPVSSRDCSYLNLDAGHSSLLERVLRRAPVFFTSFSWQDGRGDWHTVSIGDEP